MDDENNLIGTDRTEEQDKPLTKEEILERSRKENSRGDERTANAMLKASYFAMVTGGLLCLALYFLFVYLQNEARFELFFVYSAMWTVFMGVQFYYTKRRIQLAGAIGFLMMTIGSLIFLIRALISA